MLTRPGWMFVLALYVAGLLGCLILSLGSTTDDGRPTATQTATPTATVTATRSPATSTPTYTPVPTATAEHQPTLTTATPPEPSSTPTLTATPALDCRAGVITAHAAIEAVLANRPERRCVGCTYFASVLCQDLGKIYTLYVGDQTLQVTVVDCADWSVGEWPTKGGEDWLGELDIRSWPKAPLAPLKVELCRAPSD